MVVAEGLTVDEEPLPAGAHVYAGVPPNPDGVTVSVVELPAQTERVPPMVMLHWLNIFKLYVKQAIKNNRRAVAAFMTRGKDISRTIMVAC